MKNINKSALIISLIVFVITVAAATFAWLKWELTVDLDEGIALPPSTEITKIKLVEHQSLFIKIYTCSTPWSGEYLRNYFEKIMTADDWDTQKEKLNIFVFTQADEYIRLVLHPQKKQTVFTLNYRRPKKAD